MAAACEYFTYNYADNRQESFQFKVSRGRITHKKTEYNNQT